MQKALVSMRGLYKPDSAWHRENNLKVKERRSHSDARLFFLDLFVFFFEKRDLVLFLVL